jgi:hypothetical protein
VTQPYLCCLHNCGDFEEDPRQIKSDEYGSYPTALHKYSPEAIFCPDQVIGALHERLGVTSPEIIRTMGVSFLLGT